MATAIAPFTDHHLTREYVSWLNDPETVKFSEQRHHKHDLATCQAYANDMRSRGLLWAILVHDEHVGNISAHLDIPNLSADISILITAGFHGEGVGTSAFQQAMVELKEKGIRRVTVGCMARNKAMIRVALKSGLAIEAIRHNHFLINKEFTNLVEFGGTL
jgi:[ribosomal protein S5]-alanine N-acetyltransferase